MFPVPFRAIFLNYAPVYSHLHFFRLVRSIAVRGGGPKLIKAKVKTISDHEELEQFNTYEDLVKHVRKSNLGDELEVERNFLNEDLHGDVIERCDMYYDMHLAEERGMKSHIKKKIIGRKYFKLDRETNLLTHAAKVQIRFLHRLNPLEWNYKALSECFPISEAGVKKLLKTNFVLNCPEKIKAHDEDVARKWEILKSGKSSDKISPLTEKLYREGKLVDDYFSGNPNLPTALPCEKKTIELNKKKKGEFSAIVQTYQKYEKKKLSLCPTVSSEKQVSVRDTITENSEKTSYIAKNSRRFKIANEELDDDDNASPEVHPIHIKKRVDDDDDIPFSQFKETLRGEVEVKRKSKHKNEYDDFVMKQISGGSRSMTSKQPQGSENCFLKISKYKKEDIDVVYETDKKFRNIYKYDEKLGYQHPVKENVEGKIRVSPKKYKKGKLLKVGQCVYDDDGELIYRIPT